MCVRKYVRTRRRFFVYFWRKFYRAAAKEEILQHIVYLVLPILRIYTKYVHTPVCYIFYHENVSWGSKRRSRRRPLGSACKPNSSHAVKHSTTVVARQSFVRSCTNDYRRLAVVLRRRESSLLVGLFVASSLLFCLFFVTLFPPPPRLCCATTVRQRVLVRYLLEVLRLRAARRGSLPHGLLRRPYRRVR